MKSSGLFMNRFTVITAIIIAMLLALSADSFAKSINPKKAQTAALGWLNSNNKPMGKDISKDAAQTTPLIDDNGNVICYIVNLTPCGFVIISTDDQIEPIIAFSSTGTYTGSAESTLTNLLKKDLPSRIDALEKINDKHKQKKEKKWKKLLDRQEPRLYATDEILLTSASAIDDVRVEPFLATEWSQSTVDSIYCYNYYTPNHYVCGCVATAMAQVMRYYTYPTSGIGVSSFLIKVDDASQYASTRGGDGSGGAYDWSAMPEVPTSAMTTAQRQAIGALCYDAGVAAHMSYTSNSSGAYMSDADDAMTDTFQYSNCIYSMNFSVYGDEELWTILNSNLDAQMPVMLGISGTGGGHAIVADGYGYNSDTLYHHLNMGWAGSDNAWYQLPTIDAYYDFDMVDTAIYNIYTSGTGEIISGRVTDAASNPIQGVTVSAYYGSNLAGYTTTNDKGVYALTNLTSNRTYTIVAQDQDYAFTDQSVRVGRSYDNSDTGNRCDIDFEAALEGPPTVYDIEITDANSTAPTTVILEVLDDGQPDPNLLHFVITSLPPHGRLTDPGIGVIDEVPYIMSTESFSVTYEPCPYFSGTDTFTYIANDGGTEPDGGESNSATVTIEIRSTDTTNINSDSISYIYGLMEANIYAARSQLIYLQSELGSAKTFDGLAINVSTAPGITLSDWTIRMKHTTKNYYNDYTEGEPSGWTTVYQADQTITTGWNWFYFDNTFAYNGSDNLMIDISFYNTTLSSRGYNSYYSASTDRNFVMMDTEGIAGSPLDWDYNSPWDKYYMDGDMPALMLSAGSSVTPLTGDFDYSCDIAMNDLSIFAQAWQTADTDTNYNEDCDLSTTKGIIDLEDLAMWIDNWLIGYSY